MSSFVRIANGDFTTDVDAILTETFGAPSIAESSKKNVLLLVSDEADLSILLNNLSLKFKIGKLTRSVRNGLNQRGAWIQYIREHHVTIIAANKFIAGLENGEVLIEDLDTVIFAGFEKTFDISHPFAEIVSALKYVKNEGRQSPAIVGMFLNFGPEKEEEWKLAVLWLAGAGLAQSSSFSNILIHPSTHQTATAISTRSDSNPPIQFQRTVLPNCRFKKFSVHGRIFIVNRDVFQLFLDWLVSELREKLDSHATNDEHTMYIDEDPDVFALFLQVVQDGIGKCPFEDDDRKKLLRMAINFKMPDIEKMIREKMAARTAILQKYAQDDFVKIKCRDGSISMLKTKMMETTSKFKNLLLDESFHRHPSKAPYVHRNKMEISILAEFVEGKNVDIPDNFKVIQSLITACRDFEIAALKVACTKKLEELQTTMRNASQQASDSQDVIVPAVVLPAQPEVMDEDVQTEIVPHPSNQQGGQPLADAGSNGINISDERETEDNGDARDSNGAVADVRDPNATIMFELADGSIKKIKATLLSRHKETSAVLDQFPKNPITKAIKLNYGAQEYNTLIAFLKFKTIAAPTDVQMAKKLLEMAVELKVQHIQRLVVSKFPNLSSGATTVITPPTSPPPAVANAPPANPQPRGSCIHPATNIVHGRRKREQTQMYDSQAIEQENRAKRQAHNNKK